MLGVSLWTLGCKLNQLETEALASAFTGAGFYLVPWEKRRNAALVLINTCTVTSKAEQKARRAIRLVLRESPPEVPLIVTGCYARLDAEKISSLGAAGTVLDAKTAGTGIVEDSRLFVLGQKEKILDLPAFLAAQPGGGAADLIKHLRNFLGREDAAASNAAFPVQSGPISVPPAFRFNPRTFSFHSRAFLKIQDGCDNACAYCRVPLARGKSQSLDSEAVLTRVKSLGAGGAAEIVLTGVNIAQYRCPVSGKDLGQLLCSILEATNSTALRLSSLEPGPVDAPEGEKPGLFNVDFFKALSNKRIRPHFHLSVQSGSAAIVRAMGRAYGPDDVRKSAALLRSVKDDPFLACDIITGFPGETEEDFEQTCRLIEETDFAYIHAFPFSPRPGTAAFSMKNRVSERDSARRLGRLLELSRRGRKAYAKRWMGRLVEGVSTGEGGELLTENYLRIKLAPGKEGKSFGVPVCPAGKFHCRITGLLENDKLFDAAGVLSV